MNGTNDPALIIAIDGPAGSGKSTVAREVAQRLGLVYLDTGALYRSIALRAIQDGIPFDDEERLADLAADVHVALHSDADGCHIALDGVDVTDEIRTPAVDAAVSPVSAHPAVRAALLEQQRDFAHEHGVVAEGRDIGTVVFPDATLKIFLTANSEERARRRYNQNVERAELTGEIFVSDEEDVRKSLKERDEADSKRAAAPLIAASDAIQLDTSDLTIEQVVDHICFLACRMVGAESESDL